MLCARGRRGLVKGGMACGRWVIGCGRARGVSVEVWRESGVWRVGELAGAVASSAHLSQRG
jgi:hypothetical protein